MRITATCLGLVLLSSSAPYAQSVTGVPVPELAAFDDAMLDFIDTHEISASVLAVMKDGCIVYQRGFRCWDPPYPPLPENTPMRLASVEKPLTAAAIHMAVNAGLIALDQHVFNLGQPGGGILDIAPWQGLGDIRLPDITVQHLLDHQGGWDSGSAAIEDPQFKSIQIAQAMGVPSPAGRDNTTSYMLSQPLQHTPGTTSAYSNFGYMLLGLIIEHVTGVTHCLDYVRQTALTPEMWIPATELFWGRTFIEWQSEREPFYSSPHYGPNVYDPEGPEVLRPYGSWDHESMAGHGNAVASAAPLLTYLDHYFVSGGSIGQPLTGSSSNRYHTGSLDGTNTIAWQQSGEGMNIVVLLNDRELGTAKEAADSIWAIINRDEIISWPTFCVDGKWVDFNASASGFGGFDDPFHTMSETMAGTTDGTKLRLKPGSSGWTGTISQRMLIDAPFGAAVIGQ